MFNTIVAGETQLTVMSADFAVHYLCAPRKLD